MEHDDALLLEISTPGQGKYPIKLRRNFPRSKNGCLTCRQRKKKCDEVRSVCSGCRRNRLECTWPAARQPTPGKADGPQVLESGSISQSDSSSMRLDDSAGHVSSPGSSRISQVADDGSNAITWYKFIGAFNSQNRAAMLTPLSGLLLSHYITETAPTMTTRSGSGNTCLSSVLPIAYVDDLVMHSVMAMGGTHLCSRKSDTAELKAATENHYACVLRGVRLALHDLQPEDTGKALRILSVLMLMAHYESCTGTCNNGSIFSHLRASRQLILWLMDSEHQPRSDARYIFGYLLEMYVYLVLANSITPYGLMESRHVPYDAFLENLGSSLGTYDTFGIMFSGCHELFELIPTISRFAATRLKADELHAPPKTGTPDSDSFHTRTSACIRNWRPSQAQPFSADETLKRSAIGEVYRQAMFIYLETAVLGAAGLPASADVQSRLQEHIALIGQAVEDHSLVTSAFATIILWPMVIVGSVLLQDDQQQQLAQGLRMPLYATCTSVQTAELLELLWKDEDPRSFGPYGLCLVMEKHQINLCLS